ncbi:hypothetical protein [Vibrio comitans]|uniref:Uncharacterized protein n=1 Tax=Vibrio comitans NBRC 102076 TaxID=1219078 RepID=A0A4Y3IIZ9_9VIBR|nr:hypothetical protein [Vibrio comitans]GEA59155.1 hypothetical protein VCO01S_03480 [Vibrio comitans NBRC 102076]
MSTKKIIQINDLTKNIEKLEKANNKHGTISTVAFIAGIILAIKGMWLFAGIAGFVFLLYVFCSVMLQNAIDRDRDRKYQLLNELDD